MRQIFVLVAVLLGVASAAIVAPIAANAQAGGNMTEALKLIPGGGTKGLIEGKGVELFVVICPAGWSDPKECQASNSVTFDR
jgi:hypothetical protein